MRDGDSGLRLLHLVASFGSGALIITTLSSTIFIIVIIILIRSRAKFKRELKQTGKSVKEMIYEDIDLHQNRELHTTAIDTRDNAAYGHLSKLD